MLRHLTAICCDGLGCNEVLELHSLAGLTNDQIRNNLLEHGWSLQVVDHEIVPRLPESVQAVAAALIEAQWLEEIVVYLCPACSIESKARK